MAKKKKTTLLVQEDGKRRYISVPTERANDLHEYLRSNRVRSAPPEPAYTGVDHIELAKGSNVESVQALLDIWQ
jgi:hypothetical protein